MLDKESDAIRRVASKSNASAPITSVMRLHYALEGETEKTAGWTSVKTGSLRSLAFVRPQKLSSKSITVRDKGREFFNLRTSLGTVEDTQESFLAKLMLPAMLTDSLLQVTSANEFLKSGTSLKDHLYEGKESLKKILSDLFELHETRCKPASLPLQSHPSSSLLSSSFRRGCHACNNLNRP
ncbi:hypothetical protein HZH66_009635 [Vespula vulgaris]|uniref:Uncharacterized protein n=2 Tax=Vespula TaxID=7451 RepID=A0A834NS81_VESPE|nr:hypothetical protein HZH66_009635 [Vespula vulgaris]KAF7417021.1 hypothetical protein H0235_011552 [Vespula pensylvanica]